MSAIYGIVRLDGPPVEAHELEMMRRPMAYWGPDGGGEWREGGAGLGQLVAVRAPEDEHEAGPIALPSGAVVTPAGRLDNREELCRELRLPARAADGALIAHAYGRWGEDAPHHLLGDWSFAAWNPLERRLFLARDHFGNTALYIHREGDTLAFASSLKGLLALPQVPRRLNELQLARALVICPGDGEATMYEGVRRLQTGRLLSFDRGGLRTRRYWSLRDVPEVRLATDADYVERMLDLFSAAVRTRLRATGGFAATLSAGLDSTAVTALAARELGDARLSAYTARPAYPEVQREVPGLLVDEWPPAQLAAARWPNVEHVAVDGRHVTPLEAIRHSLATHDEPEHAIPNLPWVDALLDTARERGAGVLLTGQLGNGSVSWPGSSRPVIDALVRRDPADALRALRHLRTVSRYGWPGALWHGFAVPARALLAAERRHRDPTRQPGWRASVISPGFAQRVGLREAVRDSGWDPAFTRDDQRTRRLSYLMPGTLPAGFWWHQRSAMQGIEMRDPTIDVRLLEFCVGVPDAQFARDGQDRWLMRRAVSRLGSEEIAWARRRGAQGADIAYRLRADAPAVSEAVEQIEASGAAREYLDTGAIRGHWRAVEAGGSQGALELSRGLAAGLFLAGLADRPRPVVDSRT